MQEHPNFSNVPEEIQKTLQWLLSVDELHVSRDLAQAILRFLPKDDPITYDFSAYYFHKSKAYKKARELALELVRLLPNSYEAHFNAAKCVFGAGDPFLAEKLIRRALEFKPDSIDSKIDLAQYIGLQGRCDEGRQLLESLQGTIPKEDRNHLVLRFNLGWYKIRNKNFKEGVKDLRIGRQLKIWGRYNHNFKKPMLSETDSVTDKTVLIAGEGGAGDEIINLRFSKVLKDRGAKKVIMLTDQPLKELFRTAPDIDAVVDSKTYAELEYDFWVPCMDLPAILDVDIHEIPSAPYLSAPFESQKKWQRTLSNSKLRVGIRWKGNPRYEQDLLRAIPFKDFLDFKHSDVQLYSFQRDDGVEEFESGHGIIDLSNELKTWEDTAGALNEMDLLISTCTSVPHLAGAMGKTVWLFCPMNCYYIWGYPVDKSPWYKSVQLYRQTHFGKWKHAKDKMLEDYGNWIIQSLGKPRIKPSRIKSFLKELGL